MNKVKDLGILFDSEVSFVEHIENLALSAFKSLGFLMRVSRYFDNPQLIKSLYFAFIVSKLEYASVVWSPCYLRHELILERVQRRLMKFLSFKISGTYPVRNIDYNYLLQTHELQSLSARRKIHGARFMWKLIHNKLDSSQLLEYVNFHVPRLSARYACTFVLSQSRTNLLKNSAMVRVSRQANELYSDIFI
ncbi:hypothetical protein Zmor_012797 [Zophobas morio]|uniref:Reverse transcriptase n=1 Tax=Zophobas morio TaxID=2755281 RepID=A0AA38IE71_9CUCU|nr:hypothetical protein Zmor_012797 [Zophobas morio]